MLSSAALRIFTIYLLLISISSAQNQGSRPIYDHSSHLRCECSFPGAKFCTSSGECDAVEIGSRLKGLLKAARVYENITWSFPGDAVKQMIWKSTCEGLSDPMNKGTYAIIQDYQDWKPACISNGELKTCGLAPQTLPESGSISKDELNVKIKKFYHALKCEATNKPPSLMSRDWEVCRGDNYCNRDPTTTMPTTLPTIPSTQTTAAFSTQEPKAVSTKQTSPVPQTVPDKWVTDLENSESNPNPSESTESFSNSSDPSSGARPSAQEAEVETNWAGVNDNTLLLLYICVPIAIVLLLTFIIFGIVCYKTSLWSYVYRVQEKKKAKKRYAERHNSTISAWTDTYNKV